MRIPVCHLAIRYSTVVCPSDGRMEEIRRTILAKILNRTSTRKHVEHERKARPENQNQKRRKPTIPGLPCAHELGPQWRCPHWCSTLYCIPNFLPHVLVDFYRRAPSGKTAISLRECEERRMRR